MGIRFALTLLLAGSALAVAPLAGLLVMRHGGIDGLSREIDLFAAVALVGGVVPLCACWLHARFVRKRLEQTTYQLELLRDEGRPLGSPATSFAPLDSALNSLCTRYAK